MSAGRTLTWFPGCLAAKTSAIFVSTLVGAFVIGGPAFPQSETDVTIDDPLVARAWAVCEASTKYKQDVKMIGDYLGFALDDWTLVLAKPEQTKVAWLPQQLSAADKLNGYVWNGVISLTTDGPVQVYDGHKTHMWAWRNSTDRAIVKCWLSLKRDGSSEVDPTSFNRMEDDPNSARHVFQDGKGVPFPGWK